MGFPHLKRLQWIVAGALLLVICGAHSIDQGVDIVQVAICCEHKILPYRGARSGDSGAYVLIRETVPHLTQQRVRDNVVPRHPGSSAPPLQWAPYLAAAGSRIH